MVAGVDAMALRHGLALVGAYAVYLGLLWVWSGGRFRATRACMTSAIPVSICSMAIGATVRRTAWPSQPSRCAVSATAPLAEANAISTATPTSTSTPNRPKTAKPSTVASATATPTAKATGTSTDHWLPQAKTLPQALERLF